jgi:hypothetical protein
MSRTGSTAKHLRRALRSTLPLALAFTALLATSSCGGGNNSSQSASGGETHTFRSTDFGFHFSYTSGFRAFVTQRNYTMVSFKYYVVTNAVVGRKSIAPYSGDLSKLPPRSVVFLIERVNGGPMPMLSEPETHFPLRASSFTPVRGVSLPEGASWRESSIWANGWNLGADVYFAPRSSSADRAAIWRIVSSLRFRSLRPGELTGDGEFLVLKKASSYPVGFVQRLHVKALRAQAYLVRAPHGFYGISGLATRFPNNLPCPTRFDRSRLEFVCANGPRRWSRMGRPLWKGAGYRDYLTVLIAVKVGQDGHVLFSSSEGAPLSGVSALERKYWGKSSR